MTEKDILSTIKPRARLTAPPSPDTEIDIFLREIIGRPRAEILARCREYPGGLRNVICESGICEIPTAEMVAALLDMAKQSGAERVILLCEGRGALAMALRATETLPVEAYDLDPPNGFSQVRRRAIDDSAYGNLSDALAVVCWPHAHFANNLGRFVARHRPRGLVVVGEPHFYGCALDEDAETTMAKHGVSFAGMMAAPSATAGDFCDPDLAKLWPYSSSVQSLWVGEGETWTRSDPQMRAKIDEATQLHRNLSPAFGVWKILFELVAYFRAWGETAAMDPELCIESGIMLRTMKADVPEKFAPAVLELTEMLEKHHEAMEIFVHCQQQPKKFRAKLREQMRYNQPLAVRKEMLQAMRQLGEAPKICRWCYSPSSGQCSRCLRAAYCSRECQKKGWGLHKNHCTKKK